MNKSDTPRTDVAEFWAEVIDVGDFVRCVYSSFSKKLERELIAVTQRLVESEESRRLALRNNEALRRELAAKEVELTEANRKLDRYTRRSESGESLGDALDLVEELAESRAQVARLRDSLYALVTYPEAFKSLAEIAKKELATAVRGDK